MAGFRWFQLVSREFLGDFGWFQLVWDGFRLFQVVPRFSKYLSFLKIVLKITVDILQFTTEWKMSKYGVFSGPYFTVFWLNTDIYEVNSIRIRENTDQKKLRISSLFAQCTRWYYASVLMFLSTTTNFSSWSFVTAS